MKQFIIFLGASLLFFAVGLEANILPIVNSTSTCSSKAPCVLKWVEDGIAPTLAELPPVNIKLMTGPNQSQIEVLNLGTIPAINKELTYGIPPNLGPSGKFYFYTFNVGLAEPIWSSRFTIQDINGTIPGFDPNTINAKGDIITPSSSPNPSSSGSSDSSNNNASPTAASETSAASPILSGNAATIMGLSMAVMAVVYLG